MSFEVDAKKQPESQQADDGPIIKAMLGLPFAMTAFMFSSILSNMRDAPKPHIIEAAIIDAVSSLIAAALFFDSAKNVFFKAKRE
ncbi:MAG: hypothetical protein QW774_02885 [Candidatus Micrarchaeaceae archaeon]